MRQGIATMSLRALLTGAGCMLLAVVFLATGDARAAVTAHPHWTVITQAAPTDFHPGDTRDFYEVIAANDGGVTTTGEITVTDVLPAGVTVNEVHAYAERQSVSDTSSRQLTGRFGSCSETTSGEVTTVKCTTTEKVPLGRMVVVNINVTVPVTAVGSLANAVTVAGGGAGEPATVNTTTPVTPSSQSVPFGASMVTDVTSENGSLESQAGAHPFMFTTLLAFNVGEVDANEKCNQNLTPSCAVLNRQAKDVEVALPSGMVGDPNAVPRCTQAQFEKQGYDGCPPATQVGSMYIYFYRGTTAVQYAPVYNVEPPPGQPAELGFSVSTLAHIPIFFHVSPGSGYDLTADVSNITQFDSVRALELSIWGVPASSAHNVLRESELEECVSGTGCASTVTPKPFLTLPTSCSEQPLSIPVAGDSWQEQETAPFRELTSASIAPITGCESSELKLTPEIAVQPETTKPSVPSGYDVKLLVPQHEEPEQLATPDVRNVTVTMPTGTVINPSAANGLAGCSEAQFGLHSGKEGACPQQSLIGHVSIKTPLLEESVTGDVYVGEPECSPCSPSQAAEGKMVKLLIEAEPASERGKSNEPPVLIKLAGHTDINQANGQLTTTFDENPQLPFSELTLSLEGGQDAPLVNPASCGPIVANASLTPWSSLTPTAIASPAVSIEGCSPQGFSPSVTAGMTFTAQAGAFSPFSYTLTRPDGQQDLGAVTVHTPPGLSGIVNGVTLCGEGEANAGTCPSNSQIGEATTVLGAGSEPYTVTGGKVYLTTGYGGGSFGLSIVVPASAGPYHLTGLNGSGGEGNGSVVIRGSVAVDPTTAALTIKTNAIPTALDGIPLHIQKVSVDVNRPGFMFNPTDCDTQSVESTISSSSGTNVSSSYPFQAVNCAALKFEPSFSVSTSAHTSKADGASLNVHLAFPAGAFGSQANMHLVKVELPKQLPSRLTTLQKACTAAQFEANPAGCPAESIVGHAKAITPILPVPLEGPAYFVSHGGEAFPNLTMVLQGYGVTVELVGDTLIKNGITSSTFKTIPDVPVSNFELSLPAQPYSALTATANLCASPLVLPTEMIGQNGATIRQNTPLTVEGCKPTLDVVRHKVHNGTVTILVKVPSGGKIAASGRGLTRASKRPSTAKLVTLTLKLTKHERTTLAHLRGRKLRSAITLTFTPTHGTKLSSKVTVLVR